MITGRVAKSITVDGVSCLNLASLNFLGLLGDENIEKNAIESIRKYGVGSCGPRGFYGTVGRLSIACLQVFALNSLCLSLRCSS